MISSKIRLLSGQCPSCHHALLDAFTSFARVSKPSVAVGPSRRLPVGTPGSHRQIATINRCLSDAVRQEDDLEGETEHSSTGKFEQPSADHEAPNNNPELPWYLRVETSQRMASPLSDRQRLPDLPPNPPPLLQLMLEHISIELGLDDLSLVDLRKLDPPPALGSNLLMVLGTARSEKHLHVSADRFCRWLRTEFKISPYADGLLGRGELKLKMRRKARRAKVLSRVGSSETGNADDGLRTGWVCVNVGTVEDGNIAAQSESSIEGYVGFGAGTEGVKIVIQMLTGEKREELDLERLWGQALARQERKRARILQGEQDAMAALGIEVGAVPIEKDSPSKHNSLQPSSQFEKPSNHLPQTRSFHSSSRFFSILSSSRMIAEDDLPNASELEPRILSPSEQDTKSSLESRSPKLSNPRRQGSSGFNDNMRLLSLQSRLKYLKGLPKKDAIEVLGQGVNDTRSTSFLRSFYDSYPLFPNAQLWEHRLSLICYAINIGHHSYTKPDLVSVFQEMQASAVHIPASVFTLVVCTLLQPAYRRPIDFSRPSLSVEVIQIAVDVLEDMTLRGENIMGEEIITSLQVTTIITPDQEPKNGTRLHTDAQQRLRLLVDDYDLPKRSTESYSRVLNACAEAGKWDNFWSNWDSISRNFQRRDEELYALMFRRIAQKNHQAETMRVLRTFIPLMGREEPPIKLQGEIAEAVLQCVSIADPAVETDVQTERNERGEWVRLYRKCIDGLRVGV